MALTATCPRCTEVLQVGAPEAECPRHGVQPLLWRPPVSTYDDFTVHLDRAADFPTLLPWPMSPGWTISDFAVVAGRQPVATLTCSSGTSELDGPVDVMVVAEEPGVGLGARCAGVQGRDPGRELGEGPPAVRVRVDSQAVPLWPVSTALADRELDRSVVVGEAGGRWLWVVLRPASAVLLLRDDWILRDVSGVGPPLVEMPFGGAAPGW
jgi:hypothetical protein